MYEEIVDYDGNFGDPIAEVIDFDPLAVLFRSDEDVSIRCGAAVGLLVNFAITLDNGDPRDAKQSTAYHQLLFARDENLLAEFPEIEIAADCARKGEQFFWEALRPVYLAYVKPSVG